MLRPVSSGPLCALSMHERLDCEAKLFPVDNMHKSVVILHVGPIVFNYTVCTVVIEEEGGST